MDSILELVSANKSFGGWQKRYKHHSKALRCDMVFGIYLPPQADQGKPLPVLYWLSGLTCNDENFSQKVWVPVSMLMRLSSPGLSTTGCTTMWWMSCQL